MLLLPSTKPRRKPLTWFSTVLSLFVFSGLYQSAFAQNPTPPNLEAAADFGLLAGSTITSNTPIYVHGNSGSYTTTSTSITASDTVYTGNATPVPSALSDISSAKTYCDSLSGTIINGSLSGQTVTEGVYSILGNATVSNTSWLILSGDSNSVFILNVGGNLTIDQGAMITLDGGVLPENIYWNVAGNVTLNDNTIFYGLVFASAEISKAGINYGAASLMTLSSITLTNVNEFEGHNLFFSSSELTALNQAPPCQPQVQIQCPQNFPVQNGNFSTTVSNVTCTSNNPHANITNTCNWSGPAVHSNSAEYFKPCNQSLGNDYANPPASMLSGIGYAGILTGNQSGIGREYIAQTIPNLEANRWYYGEFYAQRGNLMQRGVTTLGMLVTPTLNTNNSAVTSSMVLVADNQPTIVPFVPQIGNAASSLTAATPTWVRVSGVFQANAAGNQNQLIIGNFSTTNNTVPVTPTGNGTSKPLSYYFIDNVRLQRLPSVAANQTITCGGSAQIGASCNAAITGLPNSSFSWSPTTGLNDPNSLNPIASPLATTQYTLTVSVDGTTYQSFVTVTVNPPTVQIAQTCNSTNGSMTFTASGANTYAWTNSAGTIVSTGATFTTTVNSTYTVTGTTSTGCSASASVQFDPCCRAYSVGNSGYQDANNPSNPAVLIPNTGNGTHQINPNGNTIVFNGTYHLTCPLELLPGQYQFWPGTTIYVEPTSNHSATVCYFNATGLQPGYNFIRAAGDVFIDVRGATFRSACDEMWGGIYLEGGVTMFTNPAGNVRTVIRDAFIGVGSVEVDQITGACPLNNFNNVRFIGTDFFSNQNGFWEVRKSFAQPLEGFLACSLRVDGQMLPYNGQASALRNGIILDPGPSPVPYGTNRYDNFRIQNSEFRGFRRHAIAGLGNNLVIGGDNTFRDNTFTAIAVESQKQWLVTITDNIIRVPIIPGSSGQAVGIHTTQTNMQIDNNTITGDGTLPGTPPWGGAGSLPWAIGVWSTDVVGTIAFEQNTVENLTFGFAFNSPSTIPGWIDINLNKFTNNYVAADFIGVAAQTTFAPAIRCNNIFRNGAGPAQTRGITIQPNTWMQDIGTNTLPNGNAFSGMAREVNNAGTNPNLRYFRYNSAQELGNVWFGNFGTAFNNTNMNGTGVCGNLGIGVNRVMGTSQAAIQEMMDSVRYLVGSEDDIRYYVSAITEYHLGDSALVPALQTYTDGLAAYNPQAHAELCLALMAYHRQAGNEALAQQYKNAVLLHNPADTDLYYHCLYFDLVQTLGASGKPAYIPSATELASLSSVAGSGTGSAQKACHLLQYYQPGTTCASNLEGLRVMAENNTVQDKSNSILGQSYPNPANDKTIIPYTLPANNGKATIELRELVTGRLIERFALNPTPGEGQLEVRVAKLLNGFYTYTLTIDGEQEATGKMVVIR